MPYMVFFISWTFNLCTLYTGIFSSDLAVSMGKMSSFCLEGSPHAVAHWNTPNSCPSMIMRLTCQKQPFLRKRRGNIDRASLQSQCHVTRYQQSITLKSVSCDSLLYEHHFKVCHVLDINRASLQIQCHVTKYQQSITSKSVSCD